MSKEFSRYGILFVVSAPPAQGNRRFATLSARLPISFIPFPARRARRAPARLKARIIIFFPSRTFWPGSRPASFLEHAEVHGKYYGTLREPILSNLHKGVDVLIDIDTQGATAIRDFDDAFVRQALADVFIMPPDLEELRRRLTKRGTETAGANRRCASRPPPAKWNTGAIIVTRLSAVRSRRTCSSFVTSWAPSVI